MDDDVALSTPDFMKMAGTITYLHAKIFLKLKKPTTKLEALYLTCIQAGAYKGKERSTPIACLGISKHKFRHVTCY